VCKNNYNRPKSNKCEKLEITQIQWVFFFLVNMHNSLFKGFFFSLKIDEVSQLIS